MEHSSHGCSDDGIVGVERFRVLCAAGWSLSLGSGEKRFDRLISENVGRAGGTVLCQGLLPERSDACRERGSGEAVGSGGQGNDRFRDPAHARLVEIDAADRDLADTGCGRVRKIASTLRPLNSPSSTRISAIRTISAAQELIGSHRNGFVALTDEQVAKRQEARDGYVRRLESAWRNPEKVSVRCAKFMPFAVPVSLVSLGRKLACCCHEPFGI
jgi:hypothetical protein